MSPINARLVIILNIGLLILSFGCSDTRKSATTFNSETGKHPANWIVDHRAAFLSDTGQCATCHGSDLKGGISGVSCFSASFNGMSCHENGPSGHPSGWSDPGSHGATAKSAPDTALGHGFLYCERCHGADFAGGAVNRSCFTCHGVSAPHSPAPWRGGAHTHTDTDSGNAPVCAQCHANGLNSSVQPNPPAAAGTEPGCFNSTLCHGEVGHATGWSSPDVHGASAKDAPGTSSGFAYCETCHGTDFAGGSSNQSCFTCHGVSAPHSPKPWRDATRTHTTTNSQNATVCNQCHAYGANSSRQPNPPATSGTAPDCFNNTLCHGTDVAGHTLPFTASTDHGPVAKADLTYCEECHASPVGGAGSNPRFNVTIGNLVNGCEDCHVTNTAHPKPWSADNAYATSHQSAGNMANACVLCHGVSLTGGTGPACSTCHTAGSPLSLINCASCHASPPSGATAPDRAGSHAKHYTITVACGSCHSNAGSGTALHYNATVDVAISPTYNGTGPASFDASAHTCSNVSCHADAYSAGTVTTPAWGTASGCGTCHGNSANGAPNTGSHTTHLATSASCGDCHAGAVSGVSGGSGHLDGNIDVIDGYPANVTKHAAGSGYSTCSSASSCHVSAYSTASVITPTWSSIVSCGSCHPSAPTTGSHTSTSHLAAVCGDCHAGAVSGVSGGTAHLDGNIDVIDGYPTNVTKHAAGSGYSTCSTASCHVNAYGVGSAITPTWSTVAGCGSCHGNSANGAPNTGSHAVHLASYPVCGDCHTGAASGVSGGSAHLDGDIDVINGYPTNVTKHTAGSGYSSCTTAPCHGTRTWGAAGASDCVSCHSSTQTITVGPLAGTGSRRAVALEFANTWSHKRSAGGAVTNYDCIVCHMEGDMSTGSRNATYHANGYIDLRDPDTGATIKGVTFGGADPGSYTSTGTDMTFPRFSRDLSSNVLEPEVQAIMVNLCLKCHDANGALSASAQVPGGSALKPFATTITGHVAPYNSNGNGNVVDVSSSFDTANAAYHPVKGKQNNSYAQGTRMIAPWDMTKTPGNTTSWGYLMSCWDCHAPSGASGVQTSTATAHGGAATLRGTAYNGGTTAAANLCLNCHATTYASTAGNHGAGSAFATGGSSGNMNTTTMQRCTYCHAYTAAVGGTNAYNLTSRPLRAENAHGVNDRTAGTVGSTWTTSGVKPYAFIRNTLSVWAPATVGGAAPPSAHTCTGTGGTCNNNMSNSSYTPGGAY
jgi:predicted CxxxxCH...CXXCH cytochrome family protein